MNPLKISTVVGARPQFIKAAACSRAVAKYNDRRGERRLTEMLIHTGQHYDDAMSAVFFRELSLPAPAHHLGVGSGTHGYQTGEMLKRLEEVFLGEQPDLVLVYGDTNSTLAGALVAAKLQIPLAHVEAGLRSFNRAMPEEVNRVVADHLANVHFCPSEQGAQNLAREGIQDRTFIIGDVMHDVLLWHLPNAQRRVALLDELGVRSGEYALATIHRAENTDHPSRLRGLFEALSAVAERGLPVILPTHPRTAKALREHDISLGSVRSIPPVSYEEMLCLQSNARVILTDSGGVQKEAYWLGVPCVTLRDETEWVETVQLGWNTLVGHDSDKIVETALRTVPADLPRPPVYGDGHAAERIVEVLARLSIT